jgi:Tfp pilus assembly protein PilF
LKDRLKFLKLTCVFALAAPVSLMHAQESQTFQLGPDTSSKSPQAKTQQKQAPAQQQNQGQGLSFGTNIVNARIARGAELALQKGDKAQALDFARRAVKAAPDDPHLWFLLGYAARLNGRFAESVDAYNKGLHISPGSVEGTSGLAQDFAAMGRTADAEKLLKQVVSAAPNRRDDTVLLGEMHMRDKDYKSAIDWLTRAERMKPDARTEVLLALSYEQTKNYNAANKYLEMARTRDPNSPEVQRSLAGYFREVGKYPDAIAALKHIKNPRPDVLAELAYTYQLNAQMDEAAKIYAQAANSMPKDLGLQISAAQAQLAIADVDGANKFLDRAAGLDPKYYRLHAVRGQIARMQERNDDAVKEYTEAIANLPADVAEGPLYGIQLHVELMQLYNSVSNPEAAKQQLQIAQNQINSLDEQGPSRPAFLRLRSLIKMNGGDNQGALADIKEAVALNPRDPNNLQQNGDILMKLHRTDEAIATYKDILNISPNNRFALISLGYASREAGRPNEAEKYFKQLAKADPSSYIPYLALGDLYTSRREFTPAQASYSKAYALAPKHAMIVAGGMNAAIEAHNLNLAGEWLNRVTPDMQEQAYVLREKERYFSFKGDYQQSANLGEQALKKLPHDRDVVVYLGYDLLHMEKYPELLSLTSQYSSQFPKEPDLPLLAGYVHKHNGMREEATKDFTEAIERDPNVETAYVNRGYMYNDQHQPTEASADFESALKLDPKDGQAHLGLAYASLDLHKPAVALKHADLAEKTMGDIREVHVIRATAYGRQEMLGKAIAEYRAALKFTPDDPALHMGLGNALFSERRYHAAVEELKIAEKFSPNDAQIDAMLARSYASLDDRNNTLHYVELAERNAKATPAPANPYGEPLLSSIYVSTGQALTTLGDDKAAMDRFTKALEVPHANRVNVRLAIAEVMTQQGHEEDAQRQIALGLMEAGTGETDPATGPQFVQVADVFRGMHDYDLSQNYLDRARKAGAPDASVRIGMANNYLAVGDTQRAKAELDAVQATADGDPNYQFLLAQANVFRQEHQGAQAMTSFAQASNAEGEDQTAQQGLLQAGGEEGYSINPSLSVLGDVAVGPIFEDSTVYVLDAKLDAATPIGPTDLAHLPPPRSSLQTLSTGAFHLHLAHLPTSSGFVQFRNARGPISVPATNSIVNRDTNDFTLNYGLNPVWHFGTNTLTFDSGIQTTIRRDNGTDPAQLNQNLFRVFTYVTSSSFFNALSFNGYIVRESGPFTDIDLHSSLTSAALNFRVGSPWGKTALITGWGSSDQKFHPRNDENYFTSSYIGAERRFGQHLDVRAMLEFLRAWRVFGGNSGIAQNLRPAANIDWTPKRNWDVQFSTSYSSTRSFHVYDATQNGFSVSYAMPFRRRITDAGEQLTYAYPLRFSAGMQAESFMNFSGSNSTQLRPYFGITIF